MSTRKPSKGGSSISEKEHYAWIAKIMSRERREECGGNGKTENVKVMSGLDRQTSRASVNQPFQTWTMDKCKYRSLNKTTSCKENRNSSNSIWFQLMRRLDNKGSRRMVKSWDRFALTKTTAHINYILRVTKTRREISRESSVMVKATGVAKIINRIWIEEEIRRRASKTSRMKFSLISIPKLIRLKAHLISYATYACLRMSLLHPNALSKTNRLRPNKIWRIPRFMSTSFSKRFIVRNLKFWLLCWRSSIKLTSSCLRDFYPKSTKCKHCEICSCKVK